MDIKTNLYPCDRGTDRPTGYHHYEASPNGIVVCRYCGEGATAASSELDDARQQVADLRAGIESVQKAIENNRGIDRAWDALNALLAGSGEQPGEVDGYCTCHDDQKGRTRDCGVKAHREAARPVPAVPDSADVRDITDQVRYAWCWYGDASREESDQRAVQFDTWLASLAVVGQGVTAEPVAVVERVHEDQPVITARVYAPESWKHLGLGTRLYAAVRPSGQGGGVVMTTYTPTPEQVEAFKKAWHEADAEGDTGNRTLRGLTAAGPLIERAVRERVAEEIERLREALPNDPDRAALELIIEDAARIARGEGS